MRNRIKSFFAEIYLSNLNSTCLRCLCEGLTDCDLTRGCLDEYCGPFYLSRVYWADAGKVTFPEDSPDRSNAFPDCAKDYPCASRIVTHYMIKYARDCNNDGVVDCLDYAHVHLLGGPGCSATSLDTVNYGRDFLRRFNNCRLY